MSFIYVVNEARPERAFRIPERWLDHPALGKGLRRVENGEVEFDKTVLTVEYQDHTHSTPAQEANTEKE